MAQVRNIRLCRFHRSETIGLWEQCLIECFSSHRKSVIMTAVRFILISFFLMQLVNSEPLAPTVISITRQNNCTILAESLLATDPRIYIDSCRYEGCAFGSGVFTGPVGTMGISNGIILISGDVNEARPPNDHYSILPPLFTDGIGYDCGGTGHYLADQLIPGYSSTDYALLHIYFTADPGINSIRVNFIFGSEEYDEWMGLLYNDVFGIYLDGNDLAHQIAFDMDDNLITINGPFFASGMVVEQPWDAGDIEFDGCTPLLEARGCLDSLVTNHVISFIVADAQDYLFDSGVLLADLHGIISEYCGGSVCLIEVNATADAYYVCGTGTTLHATVTGAWGPVTYEWSSNPNGFTSNSQNPTAGPISTGTWFIIQALDTELCDAYDSVYIEDTCSCAPAITWLECPLPCYRFSSCPNQTVIYGIHDTIGVSIDTTRFWVTVIAYHEFGGSDITHLTGNSPFLNFSALSDSILATISGNWLDGDSVIIILDSLYNINDCRTIP